MPERSQAAGGVWQGSVSDRYLPRSELLRSCSRTARGGCGWAAPRTRAAGAHWPGIGRVSATYRRGNRGPVDQPGLDSADVICIDSRGNRKPVLVSGRAGLATSGAGGGAVGRPGALRSAPRGTHHEPWRGCGVRRRVRRPGTPCHALASAPWSASLSIRRRCGRSFGSCYAGSARRPTSPIGPPVELARILTGAPIARDHPAGVRH